MFWDIYFAILAILLPLLIGSFLNVCIYRIPRGESIVHGNSHCTHCNTPIKRYDLIPVFSYLVLKGRCRRCDTKISPRYPFIELLNCLLCFGVYLRFGLSLQTLLYYALTSTLIVVSMIDLDTGEIPDRLQIVIGIIAAASFFLPNNMPWWHRVVGFFAASLILFILALLTNGFGGGDIKLMAVCGACIGFKAILVALFIGVIIGGIAGLVVMARSRRTGEDRPTIAFGPQLCIGIYIAALFADPLVNWYTSLMAV